MREEVIATRTVENMERVDFSHLNSHRDVIGFNTSHDVRLYIDYREIEWFQKNGEALLNLVINTINRRLQFPQNVEDFESVAKSKLALMKFQQQPEEKQLSLFVDYFHDEISWHSKAKEKMRRAKISKDACIQELSMSYNSRYRYPDIVKDRIKKKLKGKTEDALYSDSLEVRDEIQYLINDLVAIEFLKEENDSLPMGLSLQILNREIISFSWFLSERELTEIGCSAKGISLSECKRQCASLANYSEHSKLMSVWLDMMCREMVNFADSL